MGEADLAHASKVDPVDDQVAVLPAQDVVAFAANAEDLDRLALLLQALDVLPRKAGDIRVEATAEAALGRHHHQQMSLVAARADEERGKPLSSRDAPIEVGQN